VSAQPAEEIQMILTVIRDKEADLQLAAIAAVALYGANITIPFLEEIDGKQVPLPSRPAVADGGSLQVMCKTINGPYVRAGFLRAGFSTIELLSDPVIPVKPNLTNFVVECPDSTVPNSKVQVLLQLTVPATDCLCGAGLLVPYADGSSYSGDVSSDLKITVKCDNTDVSRVQAAFAALWQFFLHSSQDGPVQLLDLMLKLRKIRNDSKR